MQLEVDALQAEAGSARQAAAAGQVAILCTESFGSLCYEDINSIMVQVEMMQLEVDALQAEAGSARQAAEAGQAAVLEVDRLAQDNALLAARLSQMDVDLQASLLQQSMLPHSRACQRTSPTLWVPMLLLN